MGPKVQTKHPRSVESFYFSCKYSQYEYKKRSINIDIRSTTDTANFCIINILSKEPRVNTQTLYIFTDRLETGNKH